MIIVNYSNGTLSPFNDIDPSVLLEAGPEDLVNVMCKDMYNGSPEQMRDMVCDYINSQMKGWGQITALPTSFENSKMTSHDERYACTISFSVNKSFDVQRTIYSSTVLANLGYCRFPWVELDSNNIRFANAIDAVKWLREAYGIDIVFQKQESGEMRWETCYIDNEQREHKTSGTSKAECAVESAIMSATEKYKSLDV